MYHSSRRTLLATLGAGAFVGIAGCSGDSDDSGDGTDDSGDGIDGDGEPNSDSTGEWSDFPEATDPAGLTGAWPSAGNTATNSSRTDDPGPDEDDTVQWSEDRGSALGNGGAAPVAVGGAVFVGDGEGDVYAFDAESGEVRWSYETGKWIHSTAAVAGRTIYLGSDDFTVYALDATTGNEHWGFQADFEVSPSPVVADGSVFVGDTDGTFYALTTEGDEDWRLDGNGIFASPAAVDGTVLTADDSTVYALAAADGSEQWTTPLSASVARPLTVADGTVYAITYSPATLHAFALSDGTELWSFDLEAEYTGSIAVASGGVVAAAGESLVSVAADGTERWHRGVGEKADGPVVADGTIYTNVVEDLVALGLDGQERWRLSLPGSNTGGMAVADGRLFLKRGKYVVGVA